MSFNRRGDDDRNYGGRQDESSRGGNDGYRGDRGGSSYRNDDRGGPGGYGGGRGEGRREPSPRGRMTGDDRQRGGDDDRRQISRGGRSPTGRSPPPARRSGDYGAPPSGRSGYDGGRGGGGGAYGREDRGERSARPADSSFSRDDRERRGDDRAVDRGGRGNYGNDARGAAPRDDNRGGGFEDRSGDRDGRGPAGGRGGFSSDAGRDNGRDGAARGGGFDNGARGGGYGGTDRDRGGDRDRDGGRGGYAGDRGGDRDGGSRGGFGGDRGDRDGGARGGYGGGERRDRDEGGFSSRGAREGGGGGFSRGARNGAFEERSDNRDSRDQGFDSQRNDNDGGFSGGRGGGGFGRGRGAYEGSGGRGGGGGFGGDRGGSGFGGDRNGGGGRDEGGFGNRNGYNNDRNEGGGFGGGGRGSFDGGRGGFSGRGGRGGFGGDRGGSGFGGDRNGGGGFGEDRNGGGFSSGGGGGGFSSAGNDGGFTSFGRNGGGFGQDRAERNYDETTFDGSRRYAGRGYQTQMREADELYASDARNAQNQVLDADVKVKFEGQDADAIHEIVSWAKSGLDSALIDVCENRCKYTTVRPIQAAGVPIILAGRDVLAQSETGSGKSAAFMLPVVHELIQMGDAGPNKVFAIMVAPTKELVIQLNEQAIRFTKPLPGIKVVCSIGQSGYSNTIGALSCGAHILIATIGRLKDHIERGHIFLDSLRFFVLDEADRMLEDRNGTREMDMVFRNPKWHKEQIQHLLFSATLPNEVKVYARKLFKPNYITITPVEETLANKKIKQIFYQAQGTAEKNALLAKLIMEEKRRCDEDGTEFRKTLIFVNKKTTTNVLAMFFSTGIMGIKANSLHGDKGQDLRDEAIRQFRSGELKILIGTDVCERGLDIEGLEHVINYDMPTEGDRYTHRIGRTGRVHNGTATSFIENGDARILPPIVRIAKAAKQEVPDWLDDLAGGAGGDDGGFGNGGGFGRGGGGGGFGSGGGGGFGASEGFGDSAGGGFDNSSSGFGAAAAADEWGTATATTEKKKEDEGEEENPFDTGRVREALEETTQDDRTPPPSAPKPTVSALPSEFQTQNNVPDDEEW